MKSTKVAYVLNGKIKSIEVPARIHGDFAICRPLVYDGEVTTVNKDWALVYVPNGAKIAVFSKIGEAKRVMPKLKPLFKNFNKKAKLKGVKWILDPKFKKRLEEICS